MTNLDQRDLDYGQLGNAFYAQERHEWIPQRQFSTNYALTPFNSGLPVDPGNHAAQGTALREPYRSAAIRHAADIYPSLRPAAPYISQFLTERAQDAGQVDVLVGDLLAVIGAKIADRSHRTRGQDRNTRHAILVTRGTAEDEVRFTETTKMKSGWEGDDSTYLESNKIAHRSWTSWRSGGHAILQVCRPDIPSEDGLPEVLAIRLPTSVQLFRPKFARSAVQLRRRSGGKTHKTSTIDPRPAELLHMPQAPGVDLSITRSAHMSFNPFNQSEIALITSSGMWTIYRIESERTQVLQKAHMATQNPVDVSENYGEYVQDGWHRIIWCMDSYHLLVCDRQQLQLHEKAHFRSGKCLAIWRMFTENSSDCILDLRRTTVSDEHVVLLTTNSISLLRVQDSSSSTGIEVMCSWRHYRDPSDLSLRLTVIPHTHILGISILLYSSSGQPMTQYRCSGLRSGSPILSDMSASRGPLTICGLRGIAVLSIPLVRSASSYLIDRAEEDVASYFQMFALTDDLGVETEMCYALRSPQIDKSDVPVVPTWSRSVKRTITLSSDIVEDDFIVPDDEDSEEYDDMEIDVTTERVRKAAQVEFKLPILLEENFTVPYDDVYEAILRHHCRRDEVDFEELLQEATNPNDGLMHLLEERTGSSYQVRDIDNASRAAAQILDARARSTPYDDRFISAPLASLDCLGLSAMAIPDASLSTIYSKLASHWLRSLPANTPARSRIAKEKVIRQVAASICLTSHCIVPKQLLSPAGPINVPESSNQTEVMDTQDDEADHPSSPPASPKPPERLPLAALKRYTTIEHPPDKLSNPVSKVLSHWPLNSDPFEYDYTAEIAAIDAKNAEANISETDRRKLRRKEDRKRQRTENNDRKRAKIESLFRPSQPSQQTQSQAFGSDAPSSTAVPQHDVGQAQSQVVQAVPESQFQVSSQVGPASQMQPGKFGGRLAFRGKRKAGF